MRGAGGSRETEAEDRWLRAFRYAPVQGTLTPVQSLVAQLITCGLSDKEIAFFLGVAASTVKAHNTRILRSFGLSRRTQVVRYMLESGMFDPEEAQQTLAGRFQAT
jgi:DNA-binding NarL/FixJ family response regulator